MQAIRFLVNWVLIFTASLWVPIVFFFGFFSKSIGVQDDARGRTWLTAGSKGK